MKLRTKLLTACLGVLVLSGAVRAEGIGFRNELPVPVIVQGASFVNNMLRRGQPLLIPPGGMAWDNQVPPGPRFLTIYDANMPTRVLYRDAPGRTAPTLFQGRDLFFSIVPAPGARNQALLLARPVPQP